MTQEIKKYRRKVNCNHALPVAIAIANYRHAYGGGWERTPKLERDILLEEAIIALEASAERIEGVFFTSCDTKLILQTAPSSGIGTKHFFEDWEEDIM